MDKYNGITWCFKLKNSVARLTWWSDKGMITDMLKKHPAHWIEV